MYKHNKLQNENKQIKISITKYNILGREDQGQAIALRIIDYFQDHLPGPDIYPVLKPSFYENC